MLYITKPAAKVATVARESRAAARSWLLWPLARDPRQLQHWKKNTKRMLLIHFRVTYTYRIMTYIIT